VELVTIPAIVTLSRLMPPLSRLHAAEVRPGWGFWACTGSLVLLGVATWLRTSFVKVFRVTQPADSSVDIATRVVSSSAYRQPARREGMQMAQNEEYQDAASPVPLSRIREVKTKYEAHLMSKPNVVAVGIGVPMEEGRPAGLPGIIVSVTHKVSTQELRQEDQVPEQLEDIPVWVEEIGQPSSASCSESELT
jgi:hypothetical protein